MKAMDLRHESHGLMTRNSWTLTLTYFTLHFSCCFTKILHSQLTPLLNNFTMQESVTETLYIDVFRCKFTYENHIYKL